MGLAERPVDFDYSWTGLGRWASAALDALGLGRVHLVVHDIGGPVGFEIAAAVPDRIRSLLLLNTMVAVDTFRPPWVMEPFAHRFLGRAWLATAQAPLVFRTLMRTIGVGPDVPVEAIDAHLRLWGSKDPALPLRTYGVQARLAARLDDIPSVSGEHFLQEDFPAEIAAATANLTNR